jgi:hypothetical protein
LRESPLAGLVISAKDLGSFAVPNTCRRCLWLKLHIKPFPYQTFPGIFSSIDSYNKRIVHGYFHREQCVPPWLSSLGPVADCVEPPHYSKFSVTDPHTGVTLRGTPDAIFRMRDGGYTIADYKTARYTPGQETLMPIYQAQLNGYAYLGNRLGLSPVSKIALIYMEPVTDQVTASLPQSVNGQGFILPLAAKVVPVPLDPDNTITPLLQQAAALHKTPSPPPSTKDCRDCQSLSDMFRALQS